MTDTSSINALGVFLRGVAMGAADVVPGVSGGTIALITGIYDRLLASISAVDAKALTLLISGRWRKLWQHIDGRFLLLLLLGISSSVLLLANIIHRLLETYPLPLWSFFFGLVLMSAWLLWRDEVGEFTLPLGAGFLVGTVIAAAIGLAPGLSFIEGNLGFFLAGALAICAMILPGISGSFILLLLGMYGPVITAISSFDVVVMGLFGIGCIVGLLIFSRLLNWVLAHKRPVSMAILTGFLVGSLVTLWPWQKAVSTVIDRHGDSRVLQTRPVLPADYAAIHGDHQLSLCLLAATLGFVLIGFMHRHVSRRSAGAQ